MTLQYPHLPPAQCPFRDQDRCFHGKLGSGLSSATHNCMAEAGHFALGFIFSVCVYTYVPYTHLGVPRDLTNTTYSQ